MLRIERTPVLPGLRSKPILISCGSVSLSAKLFAPAKELSMADRVERQRQQRLEHEFLASRRLTLPFRQAGYWTRRSFEGFQGIMFDQHYLFLKCKGHFGTWKMDRNPAWALEDGRALDSLVKHGLG